MVSGMATEIRIHGGGAPIHQFLRDRNRSLRWLAAELGEKDPGHLSRQVKGKRPMKPDTFYGIAALLQVDPAAIGEVVIPATAPEMADAA